MGVKGLMSFVTAHMQHLIENVEFTGESPKRLIIDGIALIYSFYLVRRLEYICGGDYTTLAGQ